MITFSIRTHKDFETDRLVFHEKPFWRDVVDLIVSKYNPRWGWDYRLWNKILVWTSKKDVDLHWIPVENSCLFTEKVWGDEPCDAEDECKNCMTKKE